MLVRTTLGRPAATTAVAALLLALTACGGDGAGTGSSPAGGTSSTPSMDPSMPGMNMGS